MPVGCTAIALIVAIGLAVVVIISFWNAVP